MTFKHVKFQDSPVMRSLEKVAREKGLVKEEDLVKTASKNISLEPGGNLLVNLLKLSEGLRDAGFDKQANELEMKALAYKKAQTLYETSKEKGEDLVDQAHPKGSHKLEDVDGDEAVFETIIDQHLKNMKTVQKEPSGKLASSKDILDEVKIALGAAPWASLLSLFGKGAAPTFTAELAAPGTSAAVAGGAETAAVAPAAAAGAGGAATVGAVAAAGVAAIIVTTLITSAIYENKFYTVELEKAGNNLLSELKDVENFQRWQGQRDKEVAFEQSFKKALNAAKIAQAFVTSPSAAGLQALKDYADSLQEASNAAYKLSAAAREIYSGDGPMKPGESRSDSNFWTDTVGTSPLARLFRAEAPQLADVTITGSNFVNAAQRAIAECRIAMNQAMDIAAKETKQTTQSAGGSDAVTLQKLYADTLANIDKYSEMVDNKKLQNGPALKAWLAKAKRVITAQQTEFGKKNYKAEAAKTYLATMNNLAAKVKAFADKWMV